jgi:hypothetical protein
MPASASHSIWRPTVDARDAIANFKRVFTAIIGNRSHAEEKQTS